MYLYFCNHRECMGHIKGWERCDDQLASQGAKSRLVQGRIPQVHAGENRTAESQMVFGTAIGGQESLHGADITWI